VKTDPAYQPHLDGDNDGLACEKEQDQGAALAVTGLGTRYGVGWSMVLFAVGTGMILLSRKRRTELA
jgi:hypothetical protein